MPKFICHCSKCQSLKERTLRTIKEHLKADEQLLASNPYLDEKSRQTLAHCIDQNKHVQHDRLEAASLLSSNYMQVDGGASAEADISDPSSSQVVSFQSVSVQMEVDQEDLAHPTSSMLLERETDLAGNDSDVSIASHSGSGNESVIMPELAGNNSDDFSDSENDVSIAFHSGSGNESVIMPELAGNNSDDFSDSENDSDDIEINSDAMSITWEECGSEEFAEDIESDSDLSSGDSNELDISEITQQNSGFFDIPESLKTLQNELLQGYKLPARPESMSLEKQTLSISQIASLKHFIAWNKSNGTVNAYNLHKTVLESVSGVSILSLHMVRKLAQSITEFIPMKVDMCPNSCIAYTGKYQDLDKCPFIHHKKGLCDQERYRKSSNGDAIPRAQAQILPVMKTIKAMYANIETSKLLRHRDNCLKQALHLVGTALSEKKYSDYGNSQVHIMQHQSMGLFKDKHDIAFALSTDGAQLTMKKQSNTWILILIILNLPPTIRYKTSNVIINFATPGPNSPGDIESFLYPLFQNMAEASEGIWMYDAIDSSVFVNKAYITMGLGDMLGSAKLNGMSGHSALVGDRFSFVKGAKSSLDKGAKSQYYPISPPENSKYNPDRPTSYDLDNLPMRTQGSYWEIIRELDAAKTKAQKAKISKFTGVTRLPLCAACAAFIHPTFFPIDPFHLFYENIMALLWDTWTKFSQRHESVYLSPGKAQKMGSLVAGAMSTLPPSFCGPVRDPFLKRQSQYKVYEWMALLHWYIIPIGIEINMDSMVLYNFSLLVEAIEFAMTIKERTDADLVWLQKKINAFLKGYENLYVKQDPGNISRCRLCVFQLVHVPLHIQWNGSIRLGSQATVERSIGEMGHKIHSKKAPFQNMINLIYEKELIKLVMLYFPELDPESKKNPTSENKLMQQHRPSRQNKEDITAELQAISSWLKIDIVARNETFQRWGKLRLSNGKVLQSQLSHIKGQSGRLYKWFEAVQTLENSTHNIIFGEALAFYELELANPLKIVVFHPLSNTKQALNVIHGEWSTQILAMKLDDILDIIGIWTAPNSQRVYMLRKHPGLEWLSPEECGQEPDNLVE